MAVFSGNAHPKLAHDIARHLHLPLARALVGRFSDGEINVEILENIRGRETFIVQPTSPPSAENLMELLVMVDAAKRASSGRITAVIPYFGFARQDRRPRSSRVPITAKLVAKMIATAGVDRVLTVDLHADQIQGFFDISVVYQDETEGLFADKAVLAATEASPFTRPGVTVDPDVFNVDSYTTVDARIGIETFDETWEVALWGKNLTDKYYWNNATQGLDNLYRLASMPRTYGVSAAYRF